MGIQQKQANVNLRSQSGLYINSDYFCLHTVNQVILARHLFSLFASIKLYTFEK